MKLEQLQVNKVLKQSPPKWSKFMTDVKLVKDSHTINYDQLHAYLEQHELHANEACLMREGHMARQYPKPKRKRDTTWFKDKVLSVEAQEKAKVINEEELESLADPGIAEAKAILMANLSSYGLDVLSEEESRSKMLLKQSDPMVLEKKLNIKPINYAELNRLSKDFGKHFIPQQELSDEQAFRLQTSHPNTDQSASLRVKIKAPYELPKITPDALTEGK
nr:hypothetical protein [Tanacetum cinerariifolium]